MLFNAFFGPTPQISSSRASVSPLLLPIQMGSASGALNGFSPSLVPAPSTGRSHPPSRVQSKLRGKGASRWQCRWTSGWDSRSSSGAVTQCQEESCWFLETSKSWSRQATLSCKMAALGSAAEGPASTGAHAASATWLARTLGVHKCFQSTVTTSHSLFVHKSYNKA